MPIIIAAGEFTPLFFLSRPAIKRGIAMKLEGGERLVLKTLRALQGGSTDYVDDAKLAAATKMFVKDVRDWLETLEGKEYVERARGTADFSAYATTNFRPALTRLSS